MNVHSLLQPAVLVPVVGGAVVLIGAGVALVTVSYTHLRAHETVLDLVCRLLLEKKQNKEHELLYTQVRHHLTARAVAK